MQQCDNIFINPESELDKDVLNYIVAYPKEMYESGDKFIII